MSSALPSIAQALVTDPLESSAGGYILVARSPGMINQDADFIAASPGISDYLHNLQPSQPHFYSFFPLPSGQYALVHRFIKGSRRGVNRVIVHLLVLSEALLSAVQGDIWLLIEEATFQSVDHTDDPHLTLIRLGEAALNGAVKEKALPDLNCWLPETPAQRTFERLVDRRQRLLDHYHWPPDSLERRLCGVLEALVRGEYVLLPQSEDYQDLLALAWLTLPPGDRQRIAWTTHMTPGRVLFRLANAEAPDEVRLLYPKPEVCLLLPQIEALAASAHPAVRAISGYACQVLPSDFSLLDNVEDAYHYLQWLYSDRTFLQQGASSPDELEQQLAKYWPLWAHKARYAWLPDGLELSVIYGVCKTASQLSLPLENTLEVLSQALVNTGWITVWSQPDLLDAFIQNYGSFEHNLIILALAWRALPALPRAHDKRSRLFASFYHKHRPAETLATYSAQVPLLARLSFELLRHHPSSSSTDSDPVRQTLQAAARYDPTRLTELAKSLRLEREEAFATAVVIDCAYQLNRDDIVLDLTRRLVLPLLETLSGPSLFNEMTLRKCLYSGREQADVLSQALRLYTGPLFDKALACFKALLPAKPAEAQRIVTGFAGRALPVPFDHSPEVCGLTEALFTLPDASVVDRMPFVLAEAHWVDQQGPAEMNRFRDALHRTALDARQANAAAIPVLSAIHKAAKGHLTVTYSLLLEWIADKASTLRPDTLKHLAKYLASALKLEKSPRLLDWAPATSKVCYALYKHDTQRALELGYLWWLALAECCWDKFPTDTPPIPLYSDILIRWLPRVAELGEKPGEDVLLATFREFAAKLPRDRETALRRLELEAYIAAGEIKRDQLGFEEAVNRLDKMTRDFFELRSADFTDYALKYLLDKVPELAQKVPNLINSGNVPITVKSALLDVACQASRLKQRFSAKTS